MSSVASTITAHEQAQSNLILSIYILRDFLASKDSPFQNLIIYYSDLNLNCHSTFAYSV